MKKLRKSKWSGQYKCIICDFYPTGITRFPEMRLREHYILEHGKFMASCSTNVGEKQYEEQLCLTIKLKTLLVRLNKTHFQYFSDVERFDDWQMNEYCKELQMVLNRLEELGFKNYPKINQLKYEILCDNKIHYPKYAVIKKKMSVTSVEK